MTGGSYNITDIVTLKLKLLFLMHKKLSKMPGLILHIYIKKRKTYWWWNCYSFSILLGYLQWMCMLYSPRFFFLFILRVIMRFLTKNIHGGSIRIIEFSNVCQDHKNKKIWGTFKNLMNYEILMAKRCIYHWRNAWNGLDSHEPYSTSQILQHCSNTLKSDMLIFQSFFSSLYKTSLYFYNTYIFNINVPWFMKFQTVQDLLDLQYGVCQPSFKDYGSKRLIIYFQKSKWDTSIFVSIV